jgi:hypothetical protein
MVYVKDKDKVKVMGKVKFEVKVKGMGKFKVMVEMRDIRKYRKLDINLLAGSNVK